MENAAKSNWAMQMNWKQVKAKSKSQSGINCGVGSQCKSSFFRLPGRKRRFCDKRYRISTFRDQNAPIWKFVVKLANTLHGVEICHDRRDRRSCKICKSYVNFSRKQRFLLHNFCWSLRLTLHKCDFTLKLLKCYTLSSVLTKSYLNYWY